MFVELMKGVYIPDTANLPSALPGLTLHADSDYHTSDFNPVSKYLNY